MGKETKTATADKADKTTADKADKTTTTADNKTVEKEAERRTYYIKGVMELALRFNLNDEKGKILKANFEGGQITGYGVAPARFTTDDPELQKFIEASPLFKTKRIYTK